MNPKLVLGKGEGRRWRRRSRQTRPSLEGHSRDLIGGCLDMMPWLVHMTFRPRYRVRSTSYRLSGSYLIK